MKAITAAHLLEGVADAARRKQLGNRKITGVETDSRNVQAGDVFVAIRGERVDGHNYAQKALDAGAVLVIGEKDMPQLPEESYLRVPDVRDALITMGGNYRRGFAPCMVGVTGSVGKTTTKEFVAAVLAPFGKTLKTQGNQNNEIGMPNTLFRLTDDVKYAVVEMGMQGLGEIRKLTTAARPRAAIITCIGTSHLEQMKTRENILKAKMEICEGLGKGGLLIINGDDDLLPGAAVPRGVFRVAYGIDNTSCPVHAEHIRVDGYCQKFSIVDRQFGTCEATIPILGRHNVYNALAAYTLATRLGLNVNTVVAALKNYETVGHRQHLVEERGMQIMEDCYNANPDSMRAALETMRDMPVSGRRIAVLADMLELGTVSEEAHREVGALAARCGVDCLLTYGAEAENISAAAQESGVAFVQHYTEKEAMANWLKANCRAGDYILFKGSRSMALEDVMQQMYLPEESLAAEPSAAVPQETVTQDVATSETVLQEIVQPETSTSEAVTSETKTPAEKKASTVKKETRSAKKTAPKARTNTGAGTTSIKAAPKRTSAAGQNINAKNVEKRPVGRPKKSTTKLAAPAATNSPEGAAQTKNEPT